MRHNYRMNLAALLLVLVALVTELMLYSVNSLTVNNRWVGGKSLLSIWVSGAEHFNTDRQAVAGNRLNLGTWLGFQEAIVNEYFDSADLLRFEFRIPDSGYLAVVFDRGSERGSGIRLSRDARFPSMTFTLDRSGAFAKKVPLDRLSIGPDWHIAEIRLDGAVPEMTIDNTGLTPLPLLASHPRRIVSFRGGFSNVQVDNVDIYEKGRLAFSDSLRNSSRVAATLVRASTLVGATMAALYLLLRCAFSRWRSAKLLAVVSFNLLLVVAAILIFDRLYWSHLYLYEEAMKRYGLHPAAVRVEELRERLAKAVAPNEDIRPRLDPRLYAALELGARKGKNGVMTFVRQDGTLISGSPHDILSAHPKRSEVTRVLFMGSSQSAGAGADSLESSIGPYLASGLREELRGRAVELVVLADNGLTIGLLYGLLRGTGLDAISPDYVIVNMAANDSFEKTPTDSFRSGLRDLIAMCRSGGAGVALVLEPISLEHSDGWSLHPVLSEISIEQETRLVDLQAYMRSEEVSDSGFVWWDLVHMTSHGQELAGRMLARSVGDEVRMAGMPVPSKPN